MTTFWIIATGFICIALAFVIPPLLRKSAPKTSEVDAQKANITIYKERLAALQQEGLNAAEFAAAKLELDTLLSQDIANDIVPNSPVRARWVSILVILFIPALAVGGYFKYGNPNLINPIAAESPHNNAHGQMPKDFQAMVAKLEQRLQEKPDDSQGWQMLGRSYAMLEDYPKALQAYHKVLALGGDKDAQILADTAELSALANEGQLAGQPSLLIKSALDIDANNEKALWLSGVAATQSNHFPEAIQIWEHLLTIFPAEETESRTVIQQQIAEARTAWHKSGQVVEFASPNTATAAPLAQPPTLVAAPKLTVHVSLDLALQATVKPTDTLFIYAKAARGPAMPLAIVKKMARDLPLTVTLDDSSAMTPAMQLSKFKQVSVFARISSSGSAMPQSGDLQGQQTSVANDTPDIIEIQINQAVP
jgi:cytochrome c-type biogenesis protein CcmH